MFASFAADLRAFFTGSVGRIHGDRSANFFLLMVARESAQERRNFSKIARAHVERSLLHGNRGPGGALIAKILVICAPISIAESECSLELSPASEVICSSQRALKDDPRSHVIPLFADSLLHEGATGRRCTGRVDAG